MSKELIKISEVNKRDLIDIEVFRKIRGEYGKVMFQDLPREHVEDLISAMFFHVTKTYNARLSPTRSAMDQLGGFMLRNFKQYTMQWVYEAFEHWAVNVREEIYEEGISAYAKILKAYEQR